MLRPHLVNIAGDQLPRLGNLILKTRHFRRRCSTRCVVLINLDGVNDASRQLYKINAPAGQVLPALLEAAWTTAIAR